MTIASKSGTVGKTLLKAFLPAVFSLMIYAKQG